MIRSPLILGVLILSAPLLCSPAATLAEPAIREGQFLWFTLSESPAQVEALLGKPVVAASSGSDHLSWQFRLGGVDTHDFSHVLVFRKSSEKLVGVTRLYEEERIVEEFFPEEETSVHHYRLDGRTIFSLRLRRLPGGRLLLAMGSPARGVPTGQLVLMHESELAGFYPWLASQLEKPH